MRPLSGSRLDTVHGVGFNPFAKYTSIVLKPMPWLNWFMRENEDSIFDLVSIIDALFTTSYYFGQNSPIGRRVPLAILVEV